MTSQHDKPKRWRPRFSVRTLVIVATLVCCYAACWRVTFDYGCAAVLAHAKAHQFIGPNGEEFTLGGQLSWFDHPTAPAPFVVSIGEYTDGLYDAATDQITGERFLGSSYYFWFFGYVAKLP